ncbi:hypothetical protein TSH100_14040 [Azospirillum sp. TSH100]|nr:hypothetical protein [Azospirillum sp. TSH100]PWC86086.1 hypothetical protein TSH100_14040 [Azospirillum sp. TSH100]
MQGLSDFDRMVMASLCPSGTLVLPLLPPEGQMAEPAEGIGDDGLPDRSLLPLGLGIVSAILLASLAALA